MTIYYFWISVGCFVCAFCAALHARHCRTKAVIEAAKLLRREEREEIINELEWRAPTPPSKEDLVNDHEFIKALVEEINKYQVK